MHNYQFYYIYRNIYIKCINWYIKQYANDWYIKKCKRGFKTSNVSFKTILFQKRNNVRNNSSYPLRKKCPYSELFWPVFSRTWTVSLCIQYECGGIRTRITANTETFHAVISLLTQKRIYDIYGRAFLLK